MEALHNCWVCHVFLNVANIPTINSHIQINVALLTPASSPRVADNPVWFGGSALVANSLNAVVNRTSACLHDTTTVVLPIFSSNANGDWASGIQGSLKLASLRGFVAIVISFRLVSIASGAEFSVTSLRNVVRIVGIGINTLSLFNTSNISIMRPATIAAIVCVSASCALLST